MVDDLRGGFVVAAHLLALGRQRVGIISGPLDTSPGLLRLEGYQQALAHWGRYFDPSLVAEGHFTFASGYAAMQQLLACGPAPDAVVAGNDLSAIGAITHLREQHLRVPDDCAVIGYDDTEVGRLYDPALSTIAQPKYQLGYRGVELLVERLDELTHDGGGAQPAARTEVLDCQLLARRSTLGRNEEINCGSIASETPWLACLLAAPVAGA